MTDIGNVIAVTAVTPVTQNRMTTKRTVSRARAGYQAVNLECARLVAADPTKYPEGSLAAQWAAAVIEKQRLLKFVGAELP